MSLQVFLDSEMKRLFGTKNRTEADQNNLEALRVIVGEIQRHKSGKKVLTDAEVIESLSSLIKGERQRLDAARLTTSPLYECLLNYLPPQASEEEIRAWIKDHIDLSEGMGAMTKIMANFAGRADGKIVSTILKDMINKR